MRDKTPALKRSVLAAIVLNTALAGTALAADIELPPSVPFPESVAVAADGTLYVSSISHGGVLRVPPSGGRPVPFLKPGAHGTRSTFGVLVDDKTHTLWVASNDASGIGLKGPSHMKGAWVKGFELTSGTPKVSVQLPVSAAIANDFAIGEDGSLYVTNTAGDQIFRMKPGTEQFEVFVQDAQLAGGLDGIAFGSDGALYVNTYKSGELFRIAVDHGQVGQITKLKTSRPLTHADGLKPFKNGFLMVEGGGSLDRVTIHGDEANVETVRELSEPTGVVIAGDTVWVAEGHLSALSALQRKNSKLPSFYLRSIPTPKD